MNNSSRLSAIVIFIITTFLSFTSCNKASTPKVEISNIDYISAVSATVFVSVTDNGGAEVTSRGVCWDTKENPSYSGSKTSDGKGTGAFSTSISQLAPSTKYFVRAYATNSEGVGYSAPDTFRTTAETPPPGVTTALTAYTTSEAHIHINISNEGGAMVTVSGVCWSTSQDPLVTGSHSTDGVTSGESACSMTGLTPDTKYFVKAYATTITGTFYGNEISFTTLPESEGTITDYDGNIYNVVNIGNQRWTSENLKATTYNDGTPISLVTDLNVWFNITAPAYCYYSFDEGKYKDTYGALYNGYAVDMGNLCPAGWHIPIMDEWDTLYIFLGGIQIIGEGQQGYRNVGIKLNKVGVDIYSTNESGFTNVLGGRLDLTDPQYFMAPGYVGTYTSSDILSDYIHVAWHITRYFTDHFIGSNALLEVFPGHSGLSVRCIKNN